METTLARPTLSVVADAEVVTERRRTYVATRVGARRRVRVEWPGTSTVSRTWFHERFPELDWGAGGPGCRDLAWALLFDVTDEPTVADDWYADLADDVLRWLPVEGFVLPESDLVDWLHLPLRLRAEVPAPR
jgi:hypothetical protein